MNLKDSYLHGTDQTALIRALKWDEGVLKYQSASTSTDWISIGKIPTWNQDTTGKAQYATYLTNGTNNLTYSNLSGISDKTINSGTANYAAYYSGTNTISAEQYLSTSRGGTGKGTWTQYGIVIGGVSNTLSQITVPTWNANTTYWLKCSTNSSKVPTYSLSTIGKSDIGLGNVENKSSATIRGEITSKNVTDALGYTPYNSTNPNGYTTNTGTVTSISTGVGLIGGDITTTGTIKTKLKVENLTADDSITPTYNKNRLYPVVVDKSGNLAVVVPWTNVNSSYQTTVSDLTTIRSNASYGKQAYDTLGLANTDIDGVINRWEEVKDFLKNIAQGSDLASTLANFVTLDTAQTITGSKTFSQAINADILGTATQANRWSNTHNFTINDSDNTNSGTATAVDGSTDYVIHLPSTIKANIIGNISGSAGSVTWTNVSGRPTNVSSFTNDSGYITSSANITGTAAGITGYTISFQMPNNSTKRWVRLASFNIQAAAGQIQITNQQYNNPNITAILDFGVSYTTQNIFQLDGRCTNSKYYSKARIVWSNTEHKGFLEIESICNNNIIHICASRLYKCTLVNTYIEGAIPDGYIVAKEITLVNGLAINGIITQNGYTVIDSNTISNQSVASSTYSTYLTDGTNNISYSNLLGILDRTINASTTNYISYYSDKNTIKGTELFTVDTTNSILTSSSLLKTNTLEITNADGVKHIAFNRTSYNYICAPASGSIDLICAENVSDIGTTAHITSSSITPGTTNIINLGTSNYKWKNVYATIFNGNLNGNASSATIAQALKDNYGSRQTSMNVRFGDGTLRKFVATSSTTTGKPSQGDSNILHLAWDSAGGYDAQIALSTIANSMQFRTMSGGNTWRKWVTVITSDTGVTLTDNQTIAGNKTFSGNTSMSTAEVDSLITGNLVVQGTSSLGTIASGTWNGSLIAADYLPLGGTDSGTKRWVKKDNTTGQLYIDQRNDIQTLPTGNKTYLTYIGAQSISNSNKSNAATTNGNTYIKIFEDNILKNQYKISGSGSVRVASDSNGNITITGNTSNEVIPFTATNYSLSSASWTSATSLISYSGTFAIQIKDSGTKTNYYSGIIMINGNDGRTAVEEIPLSALMATGSDTEVPTRIYAGIQQGILKLSSQDSQITEHNITVKILKLIAL